ncbi:MAG: hypothetical protein DWI09_08610 [Planctomycetota bacterium]|nr:MAG: hypothetical protein DWI09_08585 [Planctomycetota bacterium]RLS88073.1 MAG: hypothetical protein DWI09_08610 [Planctomycetota bacterium]
MCPTSNPRQLVLDRLPSKCLTDGGLERLDRNGDRSEHVGGKYATESHARDGALSLVRAADTPQRAASVRPFQSTP